jgi:tRNA pseudouridine38-40 synthase
MSQQKYKITLCYEGTKYRGWQRLKQTPETIQGKIESVLSRIFDMPIQIDGASRTDAGVHARAQVASFTAEKRSCEQLKQELNRFLPDDIAIVAVEHVASDFHARFHAKKKTYHYRIWKADYPPVFQRKFVTVLGGELSIERMQEAIPLLVGKRDFKSFCTDKTKKSTIRDLESIEINETPEEIIIAFTGTGFLYNMVRIIVGTLIEIGLGQRDIQSIEAIFKSNTRQLAGETAPANGLCLEKIYYEM